MTELTHERLLALLRYEPNIGEFYWIARGGKVAGGLLNRNRKLPYWVISISGRVYFRSHLAFLYMTGRWPAEEMDHRDTNSANDRWDNLREASHAENNANKRCYKSNKLGLKGVYCVGRGRYRAMIQKDGRRICLGRFSTSAAAHNAYKTAAESLFGAFARAA